MLGPPPPGGGVGPTGIHEQDGHAVGNGLGEGRHTEVHGLRRERRQVQQDALPRGRGHGASDVERLQAVLAWPHGLAAVGCEPPSAPRPYAHAAFALTAPPPRAGVLGWEDLLPRLAPGRLQGPEGVRVVWCAWAAGP